MVHRVVEDLAHIAGRRLLREGGHLYRYDFRARTEPKTGKIATERRQSFVRLPLKFLTAALEPH